MWRTYDERVDQRIARCLALLRQSQRLMGHAYAILTEADDRLNRGLPPLSDADAESPPDSPQRHP